MKSKFAHFVLVAALTGASLTANSPAAATPRDPGWPRIYTDGSASLTVHQPQVDAWKDFTALMGRCAFSLQVPQQREPVYGTFRFQASTLVDADQKLVLLRGIQAHDLRFPSEPGGQSKALADAAARLMPGDAIVVSLDRLLASVRASDAVRQEARVRTEPPTIFVRTQPAVLVIVDGEPVLVDVEKTSYQRVINTNWSLYRDRNNGSFYLSHEGAWLAAPRLEGPFTGIAVPPAALAQLPSPEADKPTMTAKPANPEVIVVKQASELVVLRGQPAFSRVAATELWSVTNTDSDLFLHGGSRTYYFLAAGRWYRSATLEGPWQFASQTLPPDFKLIPPGHPKARVLAAVPGTREAEDAVLLASIPRVAELKRSELKAEVHYVGAPEFTSISGTGVSYARNTPSDVLRIGDRYYLCLNGVWFRGNGPNGPWQAADSVPQEIYAIPESSPKYHVTYVRIYSSTPDVIVVGYTPGYYGAYVSGGVVVWGTGYYYPPFVAVGVATVPVYWGAATYTWGAGAWYNPATGYYARGAAAYGPYGGYGAGSAYNPRTGTYAQGAAVAGPYGGAAAGRTYNPYTGTASAGYRASNPYGSWGEGVVSNGSNWARGGYQSTSRGTVAAGQTSQGGAGVAAQGPGGNSGYVARSGSGDIYAGANGNVYKRDDGQWYQNQNGSWNAVERGSANAPRQEAEARDRGARNAQASERWRAGGGGGGGSSTAGPRPSGQRPTFQGRRR